LTINPGAASVQSGSTAQLTADVVFTDCTSVDVTWTSNNPSVASVSSTGSTVTVTGGTPGTAVLTASATGDEGSVSNSATVTVTPVPVASVSVSPATLAMQIGQAQPASAEARDGAGNVLAGRTITWQTSNPAVATVTGTGANVVINATGSGSAVVTATSEGQSGTLNVSVGAAVASVTVSPATSTLVVGKTTQLTATARDAGGATLTRVINWVSSNPAVAEVSGTGLVTAKTTGSATITATADNVPGTAAITVIVPLAYAFADMPTSPQYTPLFRNFSGGTVSITRLSQGRYDITFFNMGIANPDITNTTVMVNATSANVNPALTAPSAYCNLVDFVVTGANSVVKVQCLDPTFFPSHATRDSRFEVMVVANDVFGGATAPGQSAMFSLHNQLNATAPYTPNPTFAWNSSGGALTVGTLGGGVWRHTSGLNVPTPRIAMVTTLGNEACLLSNGGATFVDVACRTQSNQPGNSIHTVLQIEKGRPGAAAAYAFVNNSVPDPTFSLNPGGQILVTPQGTGKWSIAFIGLSIPN